MEKGKISSLQMAMLLYPAIIATAILSISSTIAKYAGNDSWLSPILASAAGFLTVFIAVKLHKLYPGKTLIQLSVDVIGRIPGKIVGIFILFFYISRAGEMSRVYSEFLVTSFLFKTPRVVIIGLMVFLCAFCVYAGLEVLARVAQLLFPVFVLPIFFFPIVMAPDLQPGNIFPILEQGLMPPIKGAMVDVGFIADIILMMFFLPFLKDQNKGLKSGLLTVVGVTMTLVFLNLITLFVLGVTTALKTYPVMIVSRYATIGGFIENMEAVVMVIWIAGAFVKLSVFFYVIALGLAQLLNLSDYRPVVWPIGILIVNFAFWAVPSMMAISRYDNTIFPFFSAIIQILIPLMLLIIALISKRKKKGA